MPKKEKAFFIIGDWNVKIVSHEISGITGKFGTVLKNNGGQRPTEFFLKECTGHSKHPFTTNQETTVHVDLTKWSIQKSD